MQILPSFCQQNKQKAHGMILVLFSRQEGYYFINFTGTRKIDSVQVLRSQLEITTNEEVSVTLASRLREKYDLRGKGQNVHPRTFAL